MSYLVLARKWRPQRFEDIVGQEHVTRILTSAIRAGRIAHAYLFTGVRGVGKTTAARILAKALNCQKGLTPTPCNECTNCSEITAGSSMDVYEIDGASNRGIDEVRQIIENVRYQPAKSRFKIYIIDEVHQVTKDAFNALLKTLEEPPPSVKFILATTEPHRLPETILSRCQRFDFRRILVREILQRLGDIGKKEGLRITDGALLLLAREAEGSMRDAQSLLEQVLSYAIEPTGEEKRDVEVTEALLQDVLGFTERRILYDISAAVIREDAKRCVELVADVMAQGRDVPRLSRDLVEHFRNLLVFRLIGEKQGKESSGAISSSFNRLLDLPDQEIKDIQQQISELPVDTLMDYFRFMAEGDEEVARSAYPRFALETTLIQLATLPKAMSIGDVLHRLENLERKLSEAGARESRPNREEGLLVEGQARESEPPVPTHDSKDDVWRKFVTFVMRDKKFLASHLEQAQPLDLSPGQLMIGVGERHHLHYLQDPENLSSLRDFARRFFSGEVAVTVAPIPGLSPDKREDAVGLTQRAEDPKDMVQEALRIFGGSVKGIKRENG
ncbi:MAG TPA: DNA polymerase III subunit gamma/tau [Candidatus Binatia bacterium]|nr:DNA polymerase III subunit gamma/tau [Candidatus Binatia bacterium]